VPTVADRVAQTVVAMELEKAVEPKFHQDSYGYVCPEQEGELDVGRAS
jgi:retron-type reverse transcriptase